MKKNLLSVAIFSAICHLIGITFAMPSNDPNRAVRQVAQELSNQLPKDSTQVALIPFTSAHPELTAVSRVLTSMLASRLATDRANRFVGIDRTDWHRFRTDYNFLSANPKQVQRYGTLLKGRWLITGHVTRQSNLSISVNLFLWDAQSGYLKHLTNFQLPPSAMLTTLDATTYPAKHQPYRRNGLTYRSSLVLATEVADVDGDGFNELLIADERSLRALAWKGSSFRRHPTLPEIRYDAEQTPTLAHAHRTMFAVNQDGNRRDVIYISRPPDVTWKVEWNTETGPVVVPQRPMFLAHAEAFFIAAETATHQLDYTGKSTVCFEWRADGTLVRQPCPLPVDFHSVATDVMRADRAARSGEIVVVDLEGHLQVYQIDLNATTLTWQTPPLFGEGVTVGDLNGDDIPEIVVTTGTIQNQPNGELYDQFVILEKKSDLYTVGWTSNFLNGKIVDLKIGDADNDDQNELILALRNRQGSQILLYVASDLSQKP